MPRKQREIKIGGKAYTVGPDVDLEKEDVRDTAGNRVDEAYVDRVVEDVHAHLEAQGRRIGRPSLTKPGTRSPSVAVRLPEALKAAVEARAAREGKRPSEVVRDALEQYLAS